MCAGSSQDVRTYTRAWEATSTLSDFSDESKSLEQGMLTPYREPRDGPVLVTGSHRMPGVFYPNLLSIKDPTALMLRMQEMRRSGPRPSSLESQDPRTPPSTNKTIEPTAAPRFVML